MEQDSKDPKDAALEPVERGEVEESRGLAPLIKVGIVFAMLGGALALLMFATAADDAFVYSKLVDEVMADPGAWKSRPVRVEGDLKQGSIEFRENPCEYRFVIGTKGKEMPVRFPQRLDDAGYFAADQVIPRCPSKYEMQQAQQRGEQMPHSMPPPPALRTGDGV